MLSKFTTSQIVSGIRWAFPCGSWSPSVQDWQFLASGLDASEKEQVAQYAYLKDVKSTIIGRFMIKKYVSEVSGLDWKDIKILRDVEHKKPYLCDDQFTRRRVQFNVSHNGDYVALAGEVGILDIGIDLMKIKKTRTANIDEYFRLMRRKYSSAEWAVINSQKSDTEQMAMFYRFWCLKESLTKAVGTGITGDLRNISFNLKSHKLSSNVIVDDTEVFIGGCKCGSWKFEETMIDREHIVTVALNDRERNFKIHRNKCSFTILTYPELILQYQQVTDVDVDYASQIMLKKTF
ncbi:L-aminoadipate-semialdehyde dehydrogenase-phosphopantetheinyl transferase [Homalodisca vitripennis]|uniref:L-aminoadipate-semialdehyde dehydrogenase-phosphopantetheinyl transferase n=1 Tax=Homalodisca vitripennis TaxID=197043 RepID=UPI001EEAC80E|nr:L-aminoadipate-semialdehyde dehydrogenase-phosphopantetheinyl transferase [Homalodisca vitripennis]KAG8325120.1 hypothetical protein J6590_075582 [Homalodisca vitripennis]